MLCILQKLNRKMHLSKVKHSKFNESGQLLTFYFVSAVWGADTIMRVRCLILNFVFKNFSLGPLTFNIFLYIFYIY